ncbi:aminotransferase class V-fold PLP-dependent enzyme [Deltaproteobacteria bacterium TL4]
MALMDKIKSQISRIDPKLIEEVSKRIEMLPYLNEIEKFIKSLPIVKGLLEKQYEGLMGEMGHSLKPYRNMVETYTRLPEKGKSRESILEAMEKLKLEEESRWKEGYVSGAVYHGDEGHIDFLNKVYAINSQCNPLHSDLWPSITKYEAEIVSMTANMLGAEDANKHSELGEEICGVVSSGGTDSILLAMKAYRDWAYEKKGITAPEMIIPVTAHAAFDKASKYFNIKLIRIPVDDEYAADVAAAKKALTKNTIVLVGSAPSFPHGIMDPIEELAQLAQKQGIGFHTDACLGGFLLPWAKKLGYEVPPFDFRVPGVTSISADTHKFGFASKGTSVILYRGNELRHYQYYTIADWPGGIYFSPTFAGSRPGALSAACWAAMISVGEQGYMEHAKKILESAEQLKEGLKAIPELYILGNPLWVVAFNAKKLNIYKIMDFMTQRKWNLNGLHRPSCVHLCVTLRHTQPGVIKRFLDDLKDAVDHVKKHPEVSDGVAPIYGMAATIPAKGVVGDMLKRYMDLLYKA